MVSPEPRPIVSQLFEAGAADVLYLIDLSGYVFRAYHAIQPLNNAHGEPTHATLGTVNMLERLLKQCRPALIAVAMDSGKQTFRRTIYPEYKAHRPEAPPDLHQQMKRVEEIVRALGIPVLVHTGVEADDIIATAVSQARERGLRTVIVSSDKDLLTLVGPDVVLWDTMRDRVLGPDEVTERFGVRVDQMTDLLALMGDTSDNIPGVPSVGPKTAAELLNEHGSIQGIFEHVGEIKRKKLRETLEAHREQAFLSQRLVALRHDCPIELDLIALGRPERDLATLRRVYTELGFQRQLTNLLAEPEPAPAPRVEVAFTPALGIVTQPSELSELIINARQVGHLVVLPATQAVGLREDVIGLGLAVDAEHGYYLPLGHRYVGAPAQLPLDALRAELAAAPGAPPLVYGGHDLKHTRVSLARLGIDVEALGFDALLASYLLDPEADNALATIAKRELSVELGSIEALTHPKRGHHTPLDLVPIEELGPLFATRAALLAALWPLLDARLDEQRLNDVYQKLELPLSKLLADLEQRGVLVDVARLSQIGLELDARLTELEQEAQRVAGRTFNVHSPRQLEVLLFDELGLKPLKRTKTSRSTDAATLEALSDKHALPDVVLSIRQLSKLKSTYIDALPSLMDPGTGRIHTRWGQATAATGRLASSEPNLQNIPIRTELGRSIRAAFIAPPGHELVSADYSQIELRVLAHLSQDEVLIDAFRSNQDIHTRTAMEIFDLTPETITAEHRRRAKAVNFGVIYGQGDSGLAKSLGIPRGEAESFIAAYFHRYHGVRRFMEETLDRARAAGSIRTLLGRQRLMPDIRNPNRARRLAAERIAMNTPIQGTAADLLKLAMLALAAPVTPGCRMILTVHDELVFEVPTAEVGDALALIKQRMEAVYALDVPLVVDVGHAAAWSEAH
jgi:DNA polymerase-1